MISFSTSFKPLIIACSIALAACSISDDDNDGGNNGSSANSLRGTAAAGAAIIGTVTVKGAAGNTRSATIEANGNYDVDVTGLTAPYRLRAQGTVGGKTYKLHSYAESSDVNGNVNITPFTDLIVANAAQTIAENFFESTTTTSIDPVVLEEQEEALQAKLQDVFSALGLGTAIDLLNDTFSADHSGLDAALDIIAIEVDTNTNIATITNLIDQSAIQDNVLDDTDTEAFVVNPGEENNYTEAVSDTQAIANTFESFADAFASGLPSATNIQDYLTDDFLLGDESKGAFLTEITTDPSLVGLGFASVSISDLDSTAGTAKVTFNVIFGGDVDDESETWFVTKDSVLGWQMRGDQRIVDINELNFHCNDYDGEDQNPGGCGINVSFWDEDFSNNNTGGLAIASGTFTLKDPSGTVKELVYLGNPPQSSAGEISIYNVSGDVNTQGNYSGDWREFGTGTNQVDIASFTPGDIIEYNIYTDELNVSDPTNPSVSLGSEVATYTDTVLFAPSNIGLYPAATAATISALDSFSLGDNLTIAWTLQPGTRSDEVLIEIRDNQGNRTEVWDDSFSSSDTSITVASTEFDASGLDQSAESYELLVRIYAEDETTGQSHSTDYRRNIAGPAAPGEGGGDNGGSGSSPLSCGYESGWNDTLDEPSTFSSYDDFLSVLADCGGAMTMSESDVIGTWQETYSDSEGNWTENIIFSSGGSGQYEEFLNGQFVDDGQINWSVSNNLLTITGTYFDFDSSTTHSFKAVMAKYANGLIAYEEDSGWSISPNTATLDSTAEGEIWYPGWVKQ